MHEKTTFSSLKVTFRILKVIFSALKVIFSALKVTFSRLKVTFSDEFSRKLEAKGHLFQEKAYPLVAKGQL
jgi:hypothetical protein